MKKMIDSIVTEQFLTLLMEHQKGIYAYILSMVRNLSDADDIMQDCTAVMWRKFGEFKPNTSFIAWGIQIAHYEILRFRNKKKRELFLFCPELENLLDERARQVSQTVDIRLDILKICLTKLSEKQRDLLQMRYEKKLTQILIAERLGVSVQTICKYMARSHDFLWRCIRRTLASEEELA